MAKKKNKEEDATEEQLDKWVDDMIDKFDGDITIDDTYKEVSDSIKNKEQLLEKEKNKKAEKEVEAQKWAYDRIVATTKKLQKGNPTYEQARSSLEKHCYEHIKELEDGDGHEIYKFNVSFNLLSKISNKTDKYWEFCDVQTYKKTFEKRSGSFLTDKKGEFTDFITSEIRFIQDEILIFEHGPIKNTNPIKVKELLNKHLYETINKYTSEKLKYLSDLLKEQIEAGIEVKDDEVLKKYTLTTGTEIMALMYRVGILDPFIKEHKHTSVKVLAELIAIFAKVSPESARNSLNGLYFGGDKKSYSPLKKANIEKVDLWLKAIGFDTTKLKNIDDEIVK